jgi:hypothetical protein
MRFIRLFELGSGIATGLVGLALALYVMRPAATASDYLELFSISTCAALFVATGAYFQTLSRNPAGRILVWVGGAALVYQTGAMLLKVPIGLYFLGWLGIFLTLPGLLAVLTMTASLVLRTPAED